MLPSWISFAILVGTVIACVLIGGTFPVGSPARETIKALAGALTFLSVGVGVWIVVSERPPK